MQCIYVFHTILTVSTDCFRKEHFPKVFVIETYVILFWLIPLCYTEYKRSITVKRNTLIWCGFDRASSLICGYKMPTRCNRGFYCRSYCLLNMFWAPLCPSSGAQEYYTVVASCGISCCGFQVAGLVWSWGLCVRFAGCLLVNQQASCKPDT